MGRQSRIYNDNGLEVRYNYDALDRISHIRYGNGVETAYAYDVDGNISSMETKAGENILLSFAYEYDGNGNRTAKTGMQMTAGSCALDISYDYDIRGQLLEECRNGTSTQYTYDKAGNRIKKTDAQGEIRYFYNAKNQLLREEAEDAEKQFTYDRQGGIIKETNPSGIRRFAYDSRHRQTKVETKDGNVQENRYDVENLRFELLENGKRTRFVYHDGELLHEEGGKDNRQTGYHLGAGIEAFTRAEETFYYQQDEQLSTAFITGRNGAVHNSYQYDAFGNELETAGQLQNRIRYTGQQYDKIIGQYYLRARYYNPVLGRFMQEDTYQGDGLNLYAYCKNNPVTYYDPSGYMTDNCSGSAVENPDNMQAENADVAWNNGWRTKDGKFASPRGSQRAGEQAEKEVWDAIAQKKGWKVERGRIYTKDSTGQVRVYDGMATDPKGRQIGLEVKSGSARKTKAQREIDKRVSKSNPAKGIGRSKGIEIGHVITIRR